MAVYRSAWISIWGSEDVGMTVNALKAEECFQFRFLFFPPQPCSCAHSKPRFTLQTVDNHGLFSLQVTGELRWGVWCLNFWQQPDKSSCPNATVPGTLWSWPQPASYNAFQKVFRPLHFMLQPYATIYTWCTKYFLAFSGFIDSTAEECDRKQGKRGGVTHSKGTWAGSWTQVRCRASAVARTTNWAKLWFWMLWKYTLQKN